MLQHAAADMLQIRLPNGDKVQSKGRVTLKANIEKLQITFEAHMLNIMLPLILGVDFLERFGVMLDYANNKAELSMTECRYPLSLC